MRNIKISIVFFIIACGMTSISKCMDQAPNSSTPQDDNQHTLLYDYFRAEHKKELTLIIEYLNNGDSDTVSSVDYKPSNINGNSLTLDFQDEDTCCTFYMIAIEHNLPELVKALISHFRQKPFAPGPYYNEKMREILIRAFMLDRSSMWDDLIHQIFHIENELYELKRDCIANHAAIEVFLRLSTDGEKNGEARILRLLANQSIKNLIFGSQGLEILMSTAGRKGIDIYANTYFQNYLDELAKHPDCAIF